MKLNKGYKQIAIVIDKINWDTYIERISVPINLGVKMIVGRISEQVLLEKAFGSNEAQLICVYGRRRIGKTFLIREFFSRKNCIYFHATGVQKSNIKKQLKKFAEAISTTFYDGVTIETPDSWEDAFGILHKQLSKIHAKKVVLFFDELPWMATPKSGLLQEIDYFWNHHWSSMRNMVLIVCGSSASWLIKKIIYNKGGLHNRTTCQIKLLPFTLHETRNYLHSKNIQLNDKHVLDLYMALGGIPYYLSYIQPGLTAQQNIQKIFFDNGAPLKDEFNKLFYSLFNNADAYIELIKIISSKKEGVRREELKTLTKLSGGGGRLTIQLNDLVTVGLIEEYVPWNRNRGEYYKLIDEFCLFYLHWVSSKNKFAQNYWINQRQKPAYYAWTGYAFESICVKHANQIVKALNINSASTIGSWRFIPRKHSEMGAQIDMIIDRADGAITLCEIKFTDAAFVIDKQYAKKLKDKVEIFKAVTKTTKQIFFVMISANGVRPNTYLKELVSGIVTLNDLFT